MTTATQLPSAVRAQTYSLMFSTNTLFILCEGRSRQWFPSVTDVTPGLIGRVENHVACSSGQVEKPIRRLCA